MIQPPPTLPTGPQIILITGNMAAGKSTVAQALAERLPKSVHLRGDLFRRMIVNGQAEMSFELSAEAQHQLALRYHLAAEAAKSYFQAGFTVVYQDIIIGSALAELLTIFQDFPLSVVVLCPRAEIVAARDSRRSKTGYPNDAVVRAFDRVLRQETPQIGYWLDTSELTVAATVDAILHQLTQQT
ncbi:MAG: AAA family ATPase [Roseiflexaceae bacterium]